VNKNYQQILFFNTSTPRIIGIKLDFNDGTLQTWLNGNLHTGRTKNIKKGCTYHPFVEFLSAGNVVILNPYS